MSQAFIEKITLRLTDTKALEKLCTVFDCVQGLYRGKKNPFLEEVMRRGVESIENEFIKRISTESFPQMIEAIQEHTQTLHSFLSLSTAAFRDIFKVTMLNKMIHVRSYQMFLELQDRDGFVMDDILGGMHFNLSQEAEAAVEQLLDHFSWYKHANT